MDDCLSDMSTGTLALAQNRRTCLESIYWMNRSPQQMETCFSSSKKTPQILDLRGTRKKKPTKTDD